MQKQPFLTDTVEGFEGSDASSDTLSITNMDGSQPIIYEEDGIEGEIDQLEAQLAGRQKAEFRASARESRNGQAQMQVDSMALAGTFSPGTRPIEERLGLARNERSLLSAHAREVVIRLNENGVFPQVESDAQLLDFLAEQAVISHRSPDAESEIYALQEQVDAVGAINSDLLSFENDLRCAVSDSNYYLFTELIRQRFGAYPFAEASAARLKCLVSGNASGGDLLVQEGRRALLIATSRLYSNEMRVQKFMEFFAALEEMINEEE